MWKKFAAVICFVFFITTAFAGCATKQPTNADPNYALYQQAMLAQFNQKQEPLLDLQLDEDGKVKGLKVSMPRQPVQLQQKRPDPIHPGWSVLNSVVKVGGVVAGIWAGGEAMEGIIKAVPRAGNVTNIGSNNSAGNDLSNSLTVDRSWNTTQTGDWGDNGLLGDTTDNSDNSDNSLEQPDNRSVSDSGSIDESTTTTDNSTVN